MVRSTKEYVLDFKNQIEEIKNNDRQCRSLFTYYSALKAELEQLRDDQKDVETAVEDPYEQREIYNVLNKRIEDNEVDMKEAKKSLENYLVNKKEIFKDFHKNKIGIFEGLLYDTLDHDALVHCLNTYDLLEKGEINVEQGKEMGYNEFHKK